MRTIVSILFYTLIAPALFAADITEILPPDGSKWDGGPEYIQSGERNIAIGLTDQKKILILDLDNMNLIASLQDKEDWGLVIHNDSEFESTANEHFLVITDYEKNGEVWTNFHEVYHVLTGKKVFEYKTYDYDCNECEPETGTAVSVSVTKNFFYKYKFEYERVGQDELIKSVSIDYYSPKTGELFFNYTLNTEGVTNIYPFRENLDMQYVLFSVGENKYVEIVDIEKRQISTVADPFDKAVAFIDQETIYGPESRHIILYHKEFDEELGWLPSHIEIFDSKTLRKIKKINISNMWGDIHFLEISQDKQKGMVGNKIYDLVTGDLVADIRPTKEHRKYIVSKNFDAVIRGPKSYSSQPCTYVDLESGSRSQWEDLWCDLEDAIFGDKNVLVVLERESNYYYFDAQTKILKEVKAFRAFQGKAEVQFLKNQNLIIYPYWGYRAYKFYNPNTEKVATGSGKLFVDEVRGVIVSGDQKLYIRSSKNFDLLHTIEMPHKVESIDRFTGKSLYIYTKGNKFYRADLP